ncbi:unnamed protein product [Amaranthus hypochondriacus]
MTCISSTQYSLLIKGSPSEVFTPTRGLRQGDPISPLLFVIGMEYLSRLMQVAGQNTAFKYHPRCKGLRLNHLLFADDLMLFCNGDPQSAHMLYQGLQSFADSSGLQPNSAKSAIYIAGIPDAVKHEIAEMVNLPTGVLPFKYLGIPLTAKRISTADCDTLVDKMTARISSWCSKSLSYAGRLQLVSSVLINICTYWCQLFILPKSVIRKINPICRSYLWHADSKNPLPSNVRWSDVCKKKKEGGLGLRNIEVWNEVAVGKLAWHIHHMSESLWVRWVHGVYTKGTTYVSSTPLPLRAGLLGRYVMLRIKWHTG